MDDFGVSMDSILTLTESVGPHFVDPENLMVLTDTMIKFIEHGGPAAFLLEDLGLLRQKNEFPKVLQMIGYVYESVALNRGVGIVVIDPHHRNIIAPGRRTGRRSHQEIIAQKVRMASHGQI